MSVRQLFRALLYLSSFALGRGALFIAPIALANLLPPADYGALELAQALASVGATLLALGTSATVPLVVLRNSETASWGGILLHQVVVSAVLFSFAVLLVVGGAPHVAWLTCLCAVALMLQALWSAALKSYGRAEASLLLDAGFWGALAIAAALAATPLVPPSQRGGWMSAAVLAYSFLLLGWTAARLLRVWPSLAFGNYAATVYTGVPIMVTTLLTVLATTSGRIGIGLLSSPELTADYAVLFRATALPMVTHQIIAVALYRRLFVMPLEELERVLPRILALVVTSVIAFWALSGLLGGLFGSAFISAFSRHRVEGLLILTQCILWSAIALNDFISTRSRVTGTVARWLMLYFGATLPVAWIYIASRPIELSVFVPIHSAIMVGYFTTQSLVMWRCGVRLRRAWSLTLLAFVLLSVLTQVF